MLGLSEDESRMALLPSHTEVSVVGPHHVAICMNERRIKRVVLWAPLCLIAASLSCSRQPPASLQRDSTPGKSGATQKPPQQPPSAAQAKAVNKGITRFASRGLASRVRCVKGCGIAKLRESPQR